MKLIVNESRHVHLTAAEGVSGQAIGRLRPDADTESVRQHCLALNVELQKYQGTPDARQKRRDHARKALAPYLVGPNL